MAIGTFFHQVVSIFDLPIQLVLIRLSILLVDKHIVKEHSEQKGLPNNIRRQI